MKLKKKAMFLVVLALMLSIMPRGVMQVKAASFEQCSRTKKTGGYYIWSDGKSIRISESSSGDGEVLVSADSGYRMGTSIISDGSVFYYFLDKNMTTASGYASVGYIYQYDIKGKTSQQIGKADNLQAIKAYYNNCLYLNCCEKNDSISIDTYCFHIKSKKLKRIAKDAMVVGVKGKYLILKPNSGSAGPLPIHSYNCAAKKKILVTQKGAGTQVIGNKLYYAVYKIEYSSSGNSVYRIYTCKLNGKGKKAISKDLECSFIAKMTKKYAYFGKYSGSTYKYYQYSFQTKKTKTITKTKYESIMGW